MSKYELIRVFTIVGSTVLVGLAIYLLSIYKRLFTGIKNIWLRRNLTVLLIALTFMSSLFALVSPEIRDPKSHGGLSVLLKELGQMILIILFVFNSVWFISRIRVVKNMSFIRHHAVVMAAIVLSAVFIYGAIHFVDNGMKFDNKSIKFTLLFAYFNSVVCGIVYTAINYVELERKRKLNEKELEVTRLMALKTKAELDALHSKVNPHFLYNALNSIADLSITDGKKARRMTIALADLFRYSINYSQNNYSTINDEVAMTDVYLQIEKIRFEDQLNYSVKIDEEAGHYLVPRFILQPIVENAVKHGLKATGQMTEIFLEVKKENGSLMINIADNGPLFPDELVPGYGVKSVYDKLDLLFPDEYEIHFVNNPRKQVSIHIDKLMKNEPAV